MLESCYFSVSVSKMGYSSKKLAAPLWTGPRIPRVTDLMDIVNLKTTPAPVLLLTAINGYISFFTCVTFKCLPTSVMISFLSKITGYAVLALGHENTEA